MDNFFKVQPVFAPDDGGGSGQDSGAPRGDEAATSSDDPVKDNQSQSDVPAPYYPEGLSDGLRGANDRETIDRLTRSVNDFRAKIGSVPAKNDEYLASFDIADDMKPYIDNLTSDSLFDQIAEKARKAGVSRSAFQTMLSATLEAAKGADLLEPPIDTKAELQKLIPSGLENATPEEQSKAIETRMNDNIAFLDQLTKGAKAPLSEEGAAFIKEALADSSEGHKFIEYVRSLGPNAGSNPIGGGGVASNGGSADLLEKRFSEPKNDPNNPAFDRASYDQLMADFKKFHGE